MIRPGRSSKADVGFHSGLLTVDVYPLVVVEVGADVLFAEVAHIRERQARWRKDDEAKKTYPQRRARYLDLVFSDGLIEISVLQTAEDFHNEGEIMHHCVYTNAYFAKDNSLIMSAHIGDKHTETIEIDLQRLIISQARGSHSKNSKYHDRIISLVQRNIHKIAKRANQESVKADMRSA